MLTRWCCPTWRGLSVVALNIFLAIYWRDHPYLRWWWLVAAANAISYLWLIFPFVRFTRRTSGH